MKKILTSLRVCSVGIAFCGMLLVPVAANADRGDTIVKETVMTVTDAIQLLEKTTDYSFFYKATDLKGLTAKDIDLKGDIQEILNSMFEDSGITYMIKGKEIILKSVVPAGVQKSTPQQSKKIKVTGVVNDNFGPVAGATVFEKGNKSNGTITDMDGKFSLDTKEGATILVTFIGYMSQELVAKAGAPLKVLLKEDSQTLDEVVVVGFGSQKKANLTGSLTTVNMDDVKGSRPLINASDALQGAVPGLLVSTSSNEPGVGKSFQLRGAFTVGAGEKGEIIKPLILIDNVEGDMDLLNPEDIATITVLKDAASTAIYGARAAGGVILVTTKQPKNKEGFTLNYNNNFAFGTAMNLPKQAPLGDYLNTYGDAGFGDTYWTYGAPSVSKWQEYLAEYKKNPSSFNTVGDGIYLDPEGKMYFLNEHDPYKSFMETSFQQTHNISISGGTDRLRYRMSGGYLTTNGVLKGDKDAYKRLNFSSFISAKITNWFTQEATVSYAKTKRRQPNGNLYTTSLISYSPEGEMPASVCNTISKDLPFDTPLNYINLSNPWTRQYDNPRIFLKSILTPVKGFEVAFEYTFDKKMYNYSYYTGKTQYTDVQGAGSKWNVANDALTKEKQYTDYNALNLYGTYGFDIAKDHHFKLMAGFNQEYSHWENLYAQSQNQAVVEVPAIGSGTGKLQASDGYKEYAVRGGFFRVNYNYKDKYLLEANGRYDGSSKFPKQNRFGFFPSVSAGWNVAQEAFMESTRNVVDALKIRGSYGVIGNQNIDNYAYFPEMSINNIYDGWLSDGGLITAISTLPALVSNTFTWEKVSTIDIGFDLNMFGNRFNVVFDWYQKDTKDMLSPGMQLPAVVGASAPRQNTADMRTKGWEVAVNWRDNIGKFSYRVGFNLSDSRSEITKYDDNAASKVLGTFYPGMQIGEIWGYQVDGFYTVDDFEDVNSGKLKEGVTSIEGITSRPGDLKLVNLRDDEGSTNMIDGGEGTWFNPGDQKVIGNTTPRYLYGINLGGSYKGFDLSIFMQGVGKRDQWIANNLVFPMYIYSSNDIKFQPLFEGLTDYWKPVDPSSGDYTAQNPNAKFPRIYGGMGNVGSNYGRQTDKYLSDASYFRIKNVTLSYTVPKQWISKISLQQLKAFVSVENLATFDHLPSGIDPEMLKWSYPAFRTVSFGFNFTL